MPSQQGSVGALRSPFLDMDRKQRRGSIKDLVNVFENNKDTDKSIVFNMNNVQVKKSRPSDLPRPKRDTGKSQLANEKKEFVRKNNRRNITDNEEEGNKDNKEEKEKVNDREKSEKFIKNECNGKDENKELNGYEETENDEDDEQNIPKYVNGFATENDDFNDTGGNKDKYSSKERINNENSQNEEKVVQNGVVEKKGGDEQDVTDDSESEESSSNNNDDNIKNNDKQDNDEDDNNECNGNTDEHEEKGDEEEEEVNDYSRKGRRESFRFDRYAANGIIIKSHNDIKENNENNDDNNENEESDNENDEYNEDGVISELEPPVLNERTKGLRNLGNTCFMNSILQCLAHTKGLVNFCMETNMDILIDTNVINFNNDGKKPHEIEEEERRRQKAVTKAFVELIKDMWSVENENNENDTKYSRYTSFSNTSDPSSFKSALTRFAPQFRGYEQHDSQELLLFALDAIHTENNKAAKISSNKMLAPFEQGVLASENGRRCHQLYLNRDNSLITDLFLGQFRSSLQCLICDNESVTFEPFWAISVPIPEKVVTSNITHCLDLFVKEEILDGDEKPRCSRCERRTRCSKRYSVERWPRILVLHIKRFDALNRIRSSKLGTHIDVDNRLDLSKYSSHKELKVNYDLYAISNHSGTLYGGHYTAHCRHPYNDKWHLCNDRMISGARAENVVSNEAYVLFLEKTKEIFGIGANDNSDKSEEESAEEEESEDGDEEW